jgi:N-formylglutamate amidohydrolase
MPKTPQNSRVKVKQIVKQNIKGDSENAQNRLKNNWQRVDLNRRPTAYEITSRKATSGLLSQPLASFLTSTLHYL